LEDNNEVDLEYWMTMWIEISRFRAGPVGFRNLWCPYNAGNFFGYWATNDFSGRAVLLAFTEAAECYCASVLWMVAEGLW
jgi:hypothetical protein